MAPAVAGPRDQLALGESGEHDDGGGRAAAICSAAEIPSSTRHLDVQDDQVGTELGDQCDGRLAVAGLATTSYPSSSSISRRSSRISVSSSAITTRRLASTTVPRT